MKYFDFRKHWGKKVKPFVDDIDIREQLDEDFSKYVEGRAAACIGPHGWNYVPGSEPHEYESCHWSQGHKGRRPDYWRFVKHEACHWLVNFQLLLANRALPTYQWRIVSSDYHSTVWNGIEGKGGVLFDLNFYSLGMTITDAERLALRDSSSRVLAPGELLTVFIPDCSE